MFNKGLLVYGVEPANNSNAITSSQSFDAKSENALQTIEQDGCVERLCVSVLNNFIRGGEVEMIIRGAAGKRLSITLLDAQGRTINKRQLSEAGAVEKQNLSVKNSPAALLFLRVSTSTEIKIDFYI